ncbi:hotdog fold thioesterase [Agarilytica rhodophyticola]|uniref:hotdog fold thioesterase n=1 Tax=Agarilytica rhodophyticola TaxID=1737490 RepID=UPI000B3461AB|nr:hotdog fold thioesterase [Agarilytica rhodophyticola]
MSIWKKDISLEILNQQSANTLVEHVGIEITEVGDDYIKGTMPVDHRTHQPMGILHGGASVVLAETLGSIAGNCAVSDKRACVGLDINANHISKVQSGHVTGIAKALHIGRATQVWEIKLYSDSGKLTCVSRLTLAVIDIA